jgi:small-conductance mechanosensitive channel
MASAVTGMITLDELLQNEYLIALVIFVASLIIAKIVNIILSKYVKRLTERTKSEVDDLILKAIIRPMDFLIIFIGLYFAFKRLSLVAPYAVYVDNVFLVICVMIVSFMVSRIFSVLINRWLRVQKKYEQTPKLISKIVAVVVYMIAILAILGYYKIEITPAVAALGLGGLAIGLALQDTLSNFFAGLHLITDRPISVGDFIEVDVTGGTTPVTGVVEDISWRSTRIRTQQNTLIIVPNAKLAGSVITNTTPQESIQEAALYYGVDAPKERGVALTVDCGVAYGSDLKKVEKITLEAAGRVQETVLQAVKGFRPVMRFKEFGESNINFYAILRAEKYADRAPLRHEFIKALKERFDKEGIEISVPARKIYYGDGKKAKRKR